MNIHDGEADEGVTFTRNAFEYSEEVAQQPYGFINQGSISDSIKSTVFGKSGPESLGSRPSLPNLEWTTSKVPLTIEKLDDPYKDAAAGLLHKIEKESNDMGSKKPKAHLKLEKPSYVAL